MLVRNGAACRTLSFSMQAVNPCLNSLKWATLRTPLRTGCQLQIISRAKLGHGQDSYTSPVSLGSKSCHVFPRQLCACRLIRHQFITHGHRPQHLAAFGQIIHTCCINQCTPVSNNILAQTPAADQKWASAPRLRAAQTAPFATARDLGVPHVYA